MKLAILLALASVAGAVICALCLIAVFNAGRIADDAEDKITRILKEGDEL